MDENYYKLAKELEVVKRERDFLKERVHSLSNELKANQNELHNMLHSRSWRVTKPLRVAVLALKTSLLFFLRIVWGLLRYMGERIPLVAKVQEDLVKKLPRLKSYLTRNAREARNESSVVATDYPVPMKLSSDEANILKNLLESPE